MGLYGYIIALKTFPEGCRIMKLMIVEWINARGITMICIKTDSILYYVVSYCWGKESISRGYTTLEACQVEANKMDNECNS